MQNPWTLWQLADSAFPSGSFAHSGGLEAAWHHRAVSDGDSLQRFIHASITQCAHGVLRFTQQAWEHPERIGEIDRECDLFLNNHVANRASRAQGKAFLASAARTFGNAALEALGRSVRAEQLPAHFAPVFGVIARELRLDAAQTRDVFLFMLVRGYLSTAVRLGIVGPIEAQQIQAQLAGNRPGSAHPGPAVQTAPMLDLLQSTHDRLYSRLFQS